MEAAVNVGLICLLCGLTLVGVQGDRLTCYVCDTMKDGRDCNDYFVQNNPVITQVSGCSACKKQKTYNGGNQYVKRECDHSTRYMQRWECNQATVFSTPGDECYCLKSLCNGADGRLRHGSHVVPLLLSTFAAACRLLLAKL